MLIKHQMDETRFLMTSSLSVSEIADAQDNISTINVGQEDSSRAPPVATSSDTPRTHAMVRQTVVGQKRPNVHPILSAR